VPVEQNKETQEQKPPCPNCGDATLVLRLNNAWHSNCCGLDFDVDVSPIATAAAERKERRSPKTGWPEAKRVPQSRQ